MTTTTFSMNHVGAVMPAAGAEQAAANSRNGHAARALSGAVLAAAIAALMVLVGSAIQRSGAGGDALIWVSLWAVAFFALLVGARVMGRFSRQLQRGWAALQARWVVARTEEAIRIAARNDPRMYRELQILRDRADWDKVGPYYYLR